MVRVTQGHSLDCDCDRSRTEKASVCAVQRNERWRLYRPSDAHCVLYILSDLVSTVALEHLPVCVSAQGGKSIMTRLLFVALFALVAFVAVRGEYSKVVSESCAQLQNTTALFTDFLLPCATYK